MEFIKRIINKVLYIFSFKFFKNQKLLEQENNQEDILKFNKRKLKSVVFTIPALLIMVNNLIANIFV